MKSLQLKVGLLIVIALSILAGFVAMLGNFSFRSGYRLYIDFDYSGNLQSGAAVKISGIKVGKVEEVQFWAGKIDEETKPPRRVPFWLARIVAGKETARQALTLRGASNAKAKRELGWTPAHPTWRRGFAEVSL